MGVEKQIIINIMGNISEIDNQTRIVNFTRL